MANGLEKNKIAGTNIQMTPGLEETTGFGTFQTPSVTQTPATVTRPIGLEEGAYGLPQDTVEATFAQRDPAGLWRTARIKQMGQARTPSIPKNCNAGIYPCIRWILTDRQNRNLCGLLEGTTNRNYPCCTDGMG